MKVHSILFTLLIILSQLVAAQEIVNLSPTKSLSQYPLKSWDMDKGMPSDMVIRILQDTTGYIWSATYKGIARFDGVNFKIFNHLTTPVIESVTSQAIEMDSRGTIWVASQKGIVQYSNHQFLRNNHLSSLNNVSVEALYYDNASATLWIGTTSNGVFCYTKDTLKPKPSILNITRDVIKSINGDKNGNIWIGTEGGSVIKYNGAYFVKIEHTQRVGSVGAFYCSSDGSIWVAAEHGIFKIKNDKLAESNIAIDKANVVLEDNHNTLWIGTNNGLFRYHLLTGKVDVLNEQMGFPNNIVRDITPDSEGNLWIATYRKGLVKLTDGIITNISETEGLSSNIITAIAQFAPSSYYVADEQGTINVINENRISQLNLKNAITSDRLKGLMVDTKSNLWISTYSGLIKRTPNGTEELIAPSKTIPAETIRLTFEDSKDNIWIGTRSNGLFCLKSNGLADEFSLKTGLSSNYIMAIAEDKKGRIIVATKNGLNIIDNNKIEKVINMSTGLPSDFAFNIHIDSNNIFWLSSNDGIIRIENDTEIFVYNIQNGLFDNTLFDILEDDYGFFWIPTDLGIIRMSREELNRFAMGDIEKYSYQVFGRSEGMKNPRCTGATKSIRASNGQLLFNTTGGVSIVTPSLIESEKLQSGVMVEGLQINNQFLTPSSLYTIKSGNNRIQIPYTAFNYKHTEMIRFRYMLEPFDKEWVEAGTERLARYTNIPSGRYTFRVMANLNDLNWEQRSASININVKPSWWQSWWFIASVAFAFSLVFWIFYRARIVSSSKQKEELERLVQLRTIQIEEQNKSLEAQSRELEKLSIVVSHSNNAVMIMDPTGEIQWVNESFKRIYGYTLEEFVHSMGSNLQWVSNDPQIRQSITRCILDKVPVSYTVQVHTKDGKPIWIQTNLTPVKNDDGTVRMIVAIDSDITELKTVESEMIAMNNEIMMQAESILQQNEEIQSQRDELEQVNGMLIRHNQNIEASIWYAHTIQKAILPAKSTIDKYFECCIVFKPRDIVSGDFYWFTRLPKSQNYLIAVADCTGHGVPGALMSMIGSRLLSEIVLEREVINPATILTQLNRLVKIALKQDSEENFDGMDIGICLLEKKEKSLTSVTFAGANRPLYIYTTQSQSIDTIRGNRKSIGGVMPDLDGRFVNHTIELNGGDIIILNSDGFIDQNGIDGKKFSVKRLHQSIIDRAHLPMQELAEFLDIAFDEYCGREPQRDDATVVALRL